ncbi:PREDICTED: uncharacterized protein LOC109338785 [Lupinus angustifolius]|uniref:uncharacterized protein LOC109338785 n=1 Tax=Lupinus angustifolius TaxID=3871 RepID=UPI00092E5423|nr:PREDICTED: uncharacterized protein LOC109338785 [Lupinus angustifolius]
MPIDVNLQKRGIHLAFACSICHAAEESSNHFFFECSFALDLWHWLENIIDSPLDSSSIQSLLRVCQSNWSPQLKLVVTASIVNTISAIWHCRNYRRFDDTTVGFRQACDMIKRDTSLTGSLSTMAANTNLFEFSTTPRFNCSPHYTLAHAITKVRWLPPSQGWIKINSDGAAHGYPGHAGGGGIFRDNNGDMLGCFATYLHIQDYLFAEFFSCNNGNSDS